MEGVVCRRGKLGGNAAELAYLCAGWRRFVRFFSALESTSQETIPR